MEEKHGQPVEEACLSPFGQEVGTAQETEPCAERSTEEQLPVFDHIPTEPPLTQQTHRDAAIPQSPYQADLEEASRIPVNPYTQDAQLPRNPYTQDAQLPRNPYTQDAQLPRNPYTQDTQLPRNPYTQAERSGYEPYGQGYRPPRDPYTAYPFTQGSVNPYPQQTPRNSADPYMEQGSAMPVNPYTRQGAQTAADPYGQQPYYGQVDPQGFYSYYPRPVQPRRKEQKGNVALVCSILSAALGYFIPVIAIPLGIIAIVFGISAIRSAKRSGRGMAVAVIALILGLLGAVGSLVNGIITLARLFELIEQVLDSTGHKPM